MRHVASRTCLPASDSNADKFQRAGLPRFHASAASLAEYEPQEERANRICYSPGCSERLFVERVFAPNGEAWANPSGGLTENFYVVEPRGTRLLLDDCLDNQGLSFSSEGRYVAFDCASSIVAYADILHTTKVVDLQTGRLVAEHKACRNPTFTSARTAACFKEDANGPDPNNPLLIEPQRSARLHW